MILSECLIKPNNNNDNLWTSTPLTEYISCCAHGPWITVRFSTLACNSQCNSGWACQSSCVRATDGGTSWVDGCCHCICQRITTPSARPTLQPTGQPTSSYAPTARPTFRPTAPPTYSPTSHPTPHVCNTQLHGCDVLTTYCEASAEGGADYTCECRRGYMPISGVRNRCDPTPSPTTNPTLFPSSAPPTLVPTSQPTAHVCNVGLSNCDLQTTECIPNWAGGPGFNCNCRQGYLPIAGADVTTQTSCVLTLAPTSNPTSTPTRAPTASPTAVPTANPTMTPTATPTAVPTANPTMTPTASAASSGVATSTVMFSLVGVIAMLVLIVVGVIIVVVRKRSADSTESTQAAPANSRFANPMYEEDSPNRDGDTGYMDFK